MPKSQGYLLPLLGVGTLAWLYYSKTAAVNNLGFYIAGVGAGREGSSPVIILNVAIQNPSNEQFHINAVSGAIRTSGNVIGNVASYTKMGVPPASEVIYPLYVRINIIGIGLDLFNLITKKIGLPKKVDFTGSINASGVVAPINLSYNVS